jgi:hypothetical protein
MSLLAQANPEDTGVTTNDGFAVGQVTADGTVGLLFASIALALLGATVYLLVRPLLLGAGRARVALAALGFGVTAAALLIEPDGPDFAQLEPLWLPITLFVVLPIALVAVFSALAERWLAEDSWFRTAPRGRVLPLLALWLAAGAVLVLVVPIFAVALLVAAFVKVSVAPAVVGVTTWVGRALLVVIAAAGTWNLVTDVTTILG